MSSALDREHAERFLGAIGGAAAQPAMDTGAVLRRSFDAIIRGDFDAFSETLTDDVELTISGFGPLDGSWHGLPSVVAATRQNFALFGVQKPEIESMISQGDSIAVLLHESGVFKTDGEAYDVRAVQWFTFSGGKIRRIQEIVAPRL